MKFPHLFFIHIVGLLLICICYAGEVQAVPLQKPVEVQLAKVYTNQNIQQYLVSEKFDGIRAIWKDQQLRTRKGHIIHAPPWFTKDLPKVWLDGELWSARNQFEYVASTVSKNIPVDSEWKKIRYMVFDAPNYKSNFKSRSAFYSKLLQSLQLEHIQAVNQFKVTNNNQLRDLLVKYTEEGAEGLMLHKETAMFANGRGNNLLKLKKFMDAEAIVLEHLRGKGKYSQMLGSLLVAYKASDGHTIKFKIGTGFSDLERKKPPPVGSRITFKYHGLTKYGLPKFASFVRVRENSE